MVSTKTVQGRGDVHYESFDDLLSEAEKFAAGSPRMLGNWTLGQMLGHLGRAMDSSIDGFPWKIHWLMEILAKLFMRRILLEGPLPAGFKLSADSESKIVPPADTSVEEGLAALRAGITRQKSETKRVSHLALGELSLKDWERAHLRHAELHMSFVLPQ